jgi:PPM family protein phosphatase
MPQPLDNALKFSGVTSAGCIRAKNEDCITWSAKLGLAIIADGMGGANAGEVAGQITAETILKEIAEGMEVHSYDLTEVDEGEKYNRATLMLYNSIQKANKVVLRIANNQPECHGMGTTALATLFYDNKISVAHVGDSRLYRLRNKQLTQLTVDHTVLQEVLSSGIYSREDAEKTVNKNIVTRAVGVTDDLSVDIFEQPTRPGDLYLICSDGLSDIVSYEDIRSLLIAKLKSEELAQDLVDLAIENGGSDNVSVVLVRVLKPYKLKRNFIKRVLSNFF